MRPSLAGSRTGNSAVTNTVLPSQLLRRHWFRYQTTANLSNHVRRKARMACQATFANAISYVFGLGSGKKMIGTNARRCVAPMADVQTRWNRPIGKIERHPVGKSVVLLQSSPKPDLAVTVCIESAFPNPAIAGLVDLLPQSVSYRPGSHTALYRSAATPVNVQRTGAT